MADKLLSVDENTDLGITLPDGTRLSARAWIPRNAASKPVPAILEYLPYRKTDGTAARDDVMHPYFAERGYACIRVDARGCGDSEGLFEDEYSEQELQDGVDIIHWIAKQPWCSGDLGMQGISWGGFNGLQIAARAPEPLKAVISIGTTVDRYADDIHYKGGVQLSENIGWAATAMAWFSMPPDPAIVGKKWREMWLHRLDNTPFLASTWLRHPNRDAYWKHGSVCEDYSSIKAAVLGMGGLHDGYRNAMAHLVENLESPVKGIVGPWNHKYPHISNIAPAIGYLQEAMRWWDHWLKGKDNGVNDDPAYRAFMMESDEPAQDIKERSGRWVTEQCWPSPSIKSRELYLGDGTLGQASSFTTAIGSALAVGQNCGEFFPFGFGPGELPDDQQQDDKHSRCFDTQTLDEDFQLLGAPKIKLRLSSDNPHAQIVARLCDVKPDGSSMLICLGMLNLRHRESFEFPHDLTPGEQIEIALTLDQSAYRVPAGHKLRLALSTSYWPYSWPESTAFELLVTAGSLSLPQRENSEGDEWLFEPPYIPSKRKIHQRRPSVETKHFTQENQESCLHIIGDDGATEDLVSGIVTASKVEETWRINHTDPSSAQCEIIWDKSFRRDGWEVRSKLHTQLSSDKTHFFVEQHLQAWEGEALVFSKEFTDKIPRY